VSYFTLVIRGTRRYYNSAKKAAPAHVHVRTLSNKIMKYYSVLVFIIALLSPRRRHVVLADKTSRRKLRVQQEHVPSTRRLEKPNEPTASSIENQQVGRRHRNNALSLDNQQGGRRGRNKRGKGGKDSPPEINPNNQPITLPAPSTSVSSCYDYY